MRIIDTNGNRAVSSVLIMLTPNEASELVDKIKGINPGLGDHVHINDIDYKREITIAIYTDENRSHFSEEVRNILDAGPKIMG
jgi:hypothetical protein